MMGTLHLSSSDNQSKIPSWWPVVDFPNPEKIRMSGIEDLLDWTIHALTPLPVGLE
jgi:hypothetical protein